jgi:hypothetical protein
MTEELQQILLSVEFLNNLFPVIFVSLSAFCGGDLSDLLPVTVRVW